MLLGTNILKCETQKANNKKKAHGSKFFHQIQYKSVWWPAWVRKKIFEKNSGEISEYSTKNNKDFFPYKFSVSSYFQR